jgi:hypothetical protein
MVLVVALVVGHDSCFESQKQLVAQVFPCPSPTVVEN